MKYLYRFVSFGFFPIVVLSLASCANAQQTGGLVNPLNSSISDIPRFLAAALRVMVMVALPIISLFIVYSGFLFVSARGNETKLGIAKKNFLYVAIGAVLILGAWLIAQLLAGTITQLVGTQ